MTQPVSGRMCVRTQSNKPQLGRSLIYTLVFGTDTSVTGRRPFADPRIRESRIRGPVSTQMVKEQDHLAHAVPCPSGLVQTKFEPPTLGVLSSYNLEVGLYLIGDGVSIKPL